ncbi:MAG: hypothetical protein ABIE42_07365 [Candidatus Eisenbacteria bacterium]
MAPLWDDVKNAIVDGYVYASDKAEEMTQIGRAKVEILKLNRQIARVMGDMGGRVFEMFDSNEQTAIPSDESLMDSVQKIHGFRQDISKWEKEIEQAKAEREASASRDARASREPTAPTE